MTDLQSVRPKHSRSTSITTITKTTSHQRKPSFHQQPPSPHQNQFPELKRHNSRQPSFTISNNSSNNTRHYISGLFKFYQFLFQRSKTFLNPSGPLLPQAKHVSTTATSTTAFGGPAKSTFSTKLFNSRLLRFVALFYVIFSLILSLNHTWHYFMSSKSRRNSPLQSDMAYEETSKNDWIPQRPYRPDDPYSFLNDITHGLKMHKMFSKSYYEAAKDIIPFWQKASNVPENDEVTAITTFTPDSWREFTRLLRYWEGPVSAIVHVNVEKTSEILLEQIQSEYAAGKSELFKNVDLHLVRVPGTRLNVLFSRNAQRNLARIFAKTDYVMDLPPGAIPATDLRRTLESNKESIDKLLQAGDMLALPTFRFKSSEATRLDVPNDKSQLIFKMSEDKMVLDDKHWRENEGPTDLERWMDAETIYAVEKYEFHYEPIVIQSKTVQPWCSERFIDNRAACILSSYLDGNEIWIMPDDFVVQMPQYSQNEASDFDRVVENRMYAKFYWEQCVHRARQLYSLGLWNTSKSQHIRDQCSRVIQNWGKGIIGKPE
ncbi:hypothetical protein BDF20DRAFT_915600 [Mycotypha africana]|uniref:uncharacterized protein n=1 Tax=Mycotypha africana TaxID=64632 RepID=UPI002301A907|nr:uncharacterized protein BDF20DRAFT_915600 [Mycotypha africana]KAI8971844.1 hypothetical protein BDF20DRAFT_915600 [Mycotypha africana]